MTGFAQERTCMLIALLLTGRVDSVFAAGPEPEVGEIAVSVGEMLHFELAGDVVGKVVPAVLVKDPSSAQSVIRVTLASDGSGNRTLRIKNGYSNPIAFDFRICEVAAEPGCRTTVENYVIAGGEQMSQLMQDHADRIIFFNFLRLRDASTGLIANVVDK